jgi:hypothetical protein
MSATTFCNGTTTSGNGTTTFCNDCGNRVDLCECRLYQPRDVDKNPVVAALLSLLIPGLGQLYNGEVVKGIVFFIGWITILAWPLAVMEAYYSARVANLERRLAVL